MTHCVLGMAMTLQDKFSGSYVVESNGCWRWTKGRHAHGYGVINTRIGGRNKQYRANRVSYEIAKGPIPGGMFVLHRCDNPSCVNPEHLFLGTQRDNMRDCISKGRHVNQNRTWPTGSAHHNSKLSDNLVRTIRVHHGLGLYYREIAKMLSLNISTVYRVATHKVWAHVEDIPVFI